MSKRGSEKGGLNPVASTDKNFKWLADFKKCLQHTENALSVGHTLFHHFLA